MGKPLERDAEDLFVDWIAAKGFTAWKLEIIGQEGWPDRTVTTDRGTVFFEFKRKDGKLRKRQEKVIAQLRANGETVFVVFSFQESRENFNEWYSGRS